MSNTPYTLSWMGEEFSLNYNGTQVKKGRLAKPIAESICAVCNEAFNKGHNEGYDNGYSEGRTEGHESGFRKGIASVQSVKDASAAQLYEAREDGYRKGYNAGCRNTNKKEKDPTPAIAPQSKPVIAD